MAANNKIKSLAELTRIVQRLQSQGREVVFTNGCYDLIHVGHVRFLREARQYGDVLIVALNSDQSVRALKGKERPLMPLEERAEIIAAMECVDFVVFFDELDPLNVINAIRPQVLVKGGDWSVARIIGREEVQSYGGKVVSLPYVEGVSSSAIVQRILKRFAAGRGENEEKRI